MSGPVSVASWSETTDARPEDSAFTRLWRAFGLARIAVAAAVLALLVAQAWAARPSPTQPWVLAVAVAYLAAGILIRILLAPPGREPGLRWFAAVAIDLAAIATLQAQQAGGLTFSPLYAVPVLMASVLGGRLIAYGTAAAVALLLLGEAGLRALGADAAAPRFLQAGLTGSAFFALAFLIHQLSGRLAREEERAQAGQQAAQLQAQVNALVIESLAEGILVVDGQARVRAANPTACDLLGPGSAMGGFSLAADAAWDDLRQLVHRTLVLHAGESAEVGVGKPGRQRRLFAQSRLASAGTGAPDGQFCVVFLEDVRDMEARLRNQKLAAMGRMSAAVAHEIRNPLAAITQANALLEEDLVDPVQRQLGALVRQNAQRLAQIVEEILDVAHVQQQPAGPSPPQDLDALVAATCAEWSRHGDCEGRLQLSLGAAGGQAPFEAEHLRRVLVNLLDNAARHGGTGPGAVQVLTHAQEGRCRLLVWSEGPPLEPAIEQHMFEPFFSSHSRSSGLGLYICRELCQRHGAEIGYIRLTPPGGGRGRGNAFFVNFSRPAPQADPAVPATMAG